jgi:hypothetical protein
MYLKTIRVLEDSRLYVRKTQSDIKELRKSYSNNWKCLVFKIII